MKTTFTILSILNILVIILLTHFTLYEIEHNGLKIITIGAIMLTAVSIFTLFPLSFKYLSRTGKSGNTHQKK